MAPKTLVNILSLGKPCRLRCKDQGGKNPRADAPFALYVGAIERLASLP